MLDEIRDPAKAVRAYLDELAAFYGEEEVDDLLDRADGLSGSPELRISDLRALVNQAADLRSRIEALIEKWRYNGEFGLGSWQEGEGPDLEGTVLNEAASELRKLLSSPSLTREKLLLALARADGQPWLSMIDASRHTAEIMYGKQADAVLKLLTEG